MANEQNLKPVRTKEEARERGRKGGIASGKARAKKKSIAELTMLVANAAISGDRLNDTEKVTGALEDSEKTLYVAALAKMIDMAASGDTKAFREVQNALDKAGAASNVSEVEDDAFTAALRERASGL